MIAPTEERRRLFFEAPSPIAERENRKHKNALIFIVIPSGVPESYAVLFAAPLGGAARSPRPRPAWDSRGMGSVSADPMVAGLDEFEAEASIILVSVAVLGTDGVLKSSNGMKNLTAEQSSRSIILLKSNRVEISETGGSRCVLGLHKEPFS
jgi:hypothetical protein